MALVGAFSEMACFLQRRLVLNQTVSVFSTCTRNRGDFIFYDQQGRVIIKIKAFGVLQQRKTICRVPQVSRLLRRWNLNSHSQHLRPRGDMYGESLGYAFQAVAKCTQTFNPVSGHHIVYLALNNTVRFEALSFPVER